MQSIKTAYLTGTSGYIGANLLHHMRGICCVTSIVRQGTPSKDTLVIPDFTSASMLKKISESADVFIHVAGLAHFHCKDSIICEQAFKNANVDVTVALAQRAAEIGVKRFIFISSISIYGKEYTDIPIDESTQITPLSPYAKSKYLAEQKILEICETSNMEFVIIRPPMVYGPLAPGNFMKLLKFINLNVPLPLKNIDNRRSFISIFNLVDFIITCTHNPKAANQIFVISDLNYISTTQLVEWIAKGLNKEPRLFNIPCFALSRIRKLPGFHKIYSQLYLSFEINITKAITLLEWSPPLKAQEGLILAAHSTLIKEDEL